MFTQVLDQDHPEEAYFAEVCAYVSFCDDDSGCLYYFQNA